MVESKVNVHSNDGKIMTKYPTLPFQGQLLEMVSSRLRIAGQHIYDYIAGLIFLPVKTDPSCAT